MKSQLKALRLRQMDETIRPWADLVGNDPPKGGWVRSIREALGMSAAQLGARMGLSRQGVADLERREGDRAVTLAALEKAAAAMNAKLVYAIVPRQSLTETIGAQARSVAERELDRIAHSMHLEDQGVASAEHASQVRERQDELLATWSRQIWSAEEISSPE